MTEELKKYLLEQCRDWMAPEEIRALERMGLTDNGEEVARKAALIDFKMEAIYGFADDETNKLVALGKSGTEVEVAKRIMKRSGDIILNNCPQCGRLARTPKARQCRHCGYDWHNR